MLEEQCKTWGGITSVAVYWPLIYFQANNTENLREAQATVKAFHERMEQMGEPMLEGASHKLLSMAQQHPLLR